MIKVLLIDPSGWQGAVHCGRAYPNVGIAYLVAVLKSFGHDALIIDLNNSAMTNAEVLDIVLQYKPNVVGISAKTATITSARTIAQCIKSACSSVPIVVGGPHSTIAWMDLVEEPWFDVVFVGEGESSFNTICEYLADGRSVEGISGVVSRKSKGQLPAVGRTLLTQTQLATLPYPEYDLFPQNVREAIRDQYPLVTSRGCVYNCIFCSVSEIAGKGFRRRTPDMILEELKWARDKYKISGFEIIDDVFNLDINRSKEFCRQLISSKLGLRWTCPNGIRADRIDSELARLMYKAGCRKVFVGVEHAEPKILAAVEKGETIEEIERGLECLKDAGIDASGYFIIGLPGDSFTAQKKSVEFIRRHQIGAHFNMLVPYRGTRLWEWTEANTRILEKSSDDGVHFGDNPSRLKITFETDEFSAADRRRAYEMVHTRLRQFGVMVSPEEPRLRKQAKILRLLWKYDRLECVPYVLRMAKSRVNQIWLRMCKLF